LLALLCGLRRGEITALRWRNVDLDAGQLAIVESTEQTSKATRLKETKTGRARTVALPSLVVEELRRHRIEQARELLRIGIRQDGESFVYAREDGQPMQPRSLTHAWDQSGREQRCRVFGSTISGTAMPHTCSPVTCIRRSPVSGSGMQRSE